MKKFFGGAKPKPATPAVSHKSNDTDPSPAPTPIHAVYSSQSQPQAQAPVQPQRLEDIHDDSTYDIVRVESFPNPHPPALTPSRSSSYGSLPPGASPPSGPPRPPSPHQQPEISAPQTLKKKNPNHPNNSSNHSISTPPAMGILRSLDAQQQQHPQGHPHPHHQHTGSNDTTVIAPARPSMGIDQRYASVNSLAASTIATMDPAAALIERKDREREKKDSGWLSKLTGGGADKDKDHHHHGHTLGHGQKERERSQSWQLVQHNNEEAGGELTRSIGFLTATASEDWAVVLDVCERASASDANAKEAIRALRREFKLGQPQAQLSAARLWAIMLRNSSDTFISQSTSRKFLDTLEDLLLSSRTNPVVKERVLDVLAAAAYASGSKKDTGFRGLWRKVKPHDKPDEGIPFDTDDAMFNPPVLGMGGAGDHGPFIVTPQTQVFHPQHQHQLSYPNQQIYHQAQAKNSEHGHGNGDAPVPPPTKERERSERKERERTHTGDRERERRDSNRDREPRDPNRERKDSNREPREPRDRDRDRDRERTKDKERSSRRDRDKDRDKDRERDPSRKHRKRHRSRDATAKIIPPEEDIRRLFQECIIGKGNAALLSQALLHMTPEDFFEELSGGREGGVVGGNAIVKEFRVKCISSQELIAAQIPWAFAGAERSRKEMGEGGDETTEEKLLGDLLSANEDLLSSLGQYEDLERVASERKVTEESRRDVGGRRGRDEIERQIHQEELLLSSSRAQPPLPANLTPGRASPNLVGGPRAPSPNWRTGTASRSPSSSPPMPPPHVPARIPSPGSRPSSIVMASGHNVNHLAPPTHVMGPRSPGFRSGSSVNGSVYGSGGEGRRSSVVTSSDDDEGWEEEYRPSEKALGKRRAADNEETDVQEASHNHQQQHLEDEFAHLGVNGSPTDDRFSVTYTDEDGSELDGERGPGFAGHHNHKHPPVQYVYDAVAERTKQRLTEGRVSGAPEVG